MLDRRTFLIRSARVAGGAVFGAHVLQGLLARQAMAAVGCDLQAGEGEGGYGELQPAGPELALPAGFTYRKFGVMGTPMSDGRPTPSAHDGMAAFPLSNGNIRLVRNHEIPGVATPGLLTVTGDFGKAYDLGGLAHDLRDFIRRQFDDARRRLPARARFRQLELDDHDLRRWAHALGLLVQRRGLGGLGGTTSLEVRVTPDGDRQLVRDFVSLSGTIMNCAGGPTPWGSWLSCEESTQGGEPLREPHGYCFEVPAAANEEVHAVPLKAMGLFVHEAVAVDPASGFIYETEDQPGAGFYRFIPDRPGALVNGGRLQMLAIAETPNYDTSTGQQVNKPLPVTWVDIPDPDPPDAEANPSAVFDQGFSLGAARFRRLEGCWYGGGSVFFNSTSGGDAGLGQVWEYQPATGAEGQLRLIFESTTPACLDGPDNLTVSPRGGILICEDGGGQQYLRGLTPEGKIFDFALNLITQREFAGATFSPDGETLFVNIQGDVTNLGMTFAIWGPWRTGAL